MTRRDALVAMTGVLGAKAIEGEVKAIDSEPEPILIMVKLNSFVSVEQKAYIRDQLEQVFKGKPHPPIVVCDQNIDIEAILDPRRA